MEENELNGKISVKMKQISVEKDSNIRGQMQKQLEILNLRKQIIFMNNKITQIINGMK